MPILWWYLNPQYTWKELFNKYHEWQSVQQWSNLILWNKELRTTWIYRLNIRHQNNEEYSLILRMGWLYMILSNVILSSVNRMNQQRIESSHITGHITVVCRNRIRCFWHSMLQDISTSFSRRIGWDRGTKYGAVITDARAVHIYFSFSSEQMGVVS